MSQKSLRVGIIGCGQIAQESHIPALRRSKGVEIVALCDRSEDLARKVAQKFGISRYYSDSAEMLKKEELNVVNICTPPRTHPPLSIQAVEAGCHVLVEKPMALSVKECDQMIAASKSNRGNLGVVHNELFKPVVMKTKSIVRKGTIGDLTGIAIQYSKGKDDDWVMNEEHWCHKLPGGIFGDMLPHIIYLAIEFLGKLGPVAVHTRKVSSYDWMHVDELYIILKARNGMGTVISSCNWPKGTAIIDIFGTKMNLRLDIYNAVLTKYARWGSNRPWRALDNVSQSFQQVACTVSTASKKIMGRYHGGDYICIQKFIESIRNNTQPPVTAEEGKEVIRVFEKITSQIDSKLEKDGAIWKPRNDI